MGGRMSLPCRAVFELTWREKLGPAFGRNQIVTRSVSEDVNASDSLAYASGYNAPKNLFEKQESTSLQASALALGLKASLL